MSKQNPREFWIEFFGDPSDDKEVYKRYSAAVPFKPVGNDAEVFHLIEYSEYERLQFELAELLKENGVCYIHETKCKPIFKIISWMCPECEIENYKQEKT